MSTLKHDGQNSSPGRATATASDRSGTGRRVSDPAAMPACHTPVPSDSSGPFAVPQVHAVAVERELRPPAGFRAWCLWCSERPRHPLRYPLVTASAVIVHQCPHCPQSEGAGRLCVGPPGRTRVVRLRGDKARERSACGEAASRRGVGRVRATRRTPRSLRSGGRLRAVPGERQLYPRPVTSVLFGASGGPTVQRTVDGAQNPASEGGNPPACSNLRSTLSSLTQA